MKELINYIKINGDKTYKEMPFNEIDAVIYTMISYVDFRGILTKPMAIKDVYSIYKKKFVSKTKEKFIIANENLFEIIATTKRYENNILEHYKSVTNEKTQFAAITIKVPHKFKFIAFEGTDDDLPSWEEDFRMSYEYPVPAQKLALKYVNKVIKFSDILVYVGGHSKGGNLALYSALNAKFGKRLRMKYVFNFDGPGFLNETVNSKKYKRIEKKLMHYFPEDSVVGMMMEHRGKKRIIKSTATRTKQHNPHTWRIDYNTFKYGSLSLYAKSFHKRFENVTTKLTVEERKKFVDSLFALLYKVGYTKKTELMKLNLIRLKNIIKEAKSLGEDDKKLMYEVIKILTNNA